MVNALVHCASTRPKNPIDYLSHELERCSCSNEKLEIGKETGTTQKPQASLYFRNAFGNSLKQALFEAILMKPENPIAEVAGRLEKNYADGVAAQSKSRKLARLYRRDAPIITDIKALTSKGLFTFLILQLNFFLPD